MTPATRPARAPRRDAVRNYERIVEAARDAFGESGADACMEQIAAKAGVGVGTVYRRFTSKDALIDELLRLAMAELTAAARQALARDDGHGLEELLLALGQSFADHASYAHLLLERQPDPAAARCLRTATQELTARAIAAGTIGPGATIDDVMALIRAIRGLAHDSGAHITDDWQRFLDIHLAGLRARSSGGEGGTGE
jgi:AcrR family transcriptional regulator